MGDSDSKPLDIEERKLRIEEAKLENERSFARRWFPTIATLTLGFVTLAFNVSQSWVAYQERLAADGENRTHEMEAAEREDARWGMGVLELYVKYPEQFDPLRSPDTAPRNLMALVSVAPGVMRPILEARAGEIVRAPDTQAEEPHVRANDQALRVIQSAVEQAVREAKMALGKQPAKIEGWPAAQDPSAYTLYVQYVGAPDAAHELAEHLKKAGFRVPGLDSVKSGPDRVEVRYYKSDQKDLAAALAADIGKTLGRTDSETTFIGASRNLPEGILEVWLPNAS